MKTNHALVRGLTLRCHASVDDKKGAVYIPQGQLTLKHCDITSDSLSGVEVCGSKTKRIISHCQIHEGFFWAWNVVMLVPLFTMVLEIV